MIQLYIYVNLLFFKVISVIGYYKILSIVLCAMELSPCWLSVLHIVVYIC